MISVEARKQQLEDRFRELDARIHRIDAELVEQVSANFSEQALEREGDQVLEDLGEHGVREMRMIEAALQRIDKGVYGICVDCGDPISEERLDALPHTPRCRDCAA